MKPVAWSLVSQQVLRALRGRHSQAVFSRALGYRSNVAYPWESGRREPSASEFFRAVAVFWGEPTALWSSFPIDLRGVDLTTAQGIGALLVLLRGNARLQTIASHLNCSRYTVGRWFKGQTEPKLSSFLRLLEALSLRASDFVFALCKPDDVPALNDHWRVLQTRRRISFTHPWSSAIVRQLELSSYQALPQHTPGWLAARLGIDRDVEASVIATLEAAGLVRWENGKYVSQPDAVDTSLASEEDRNALREHWLGEAARHIGKNPSNRFSWSVFAVSREDFNAIREMQVEYMQTLRQRIDASEPSEVVGLVSAQLVELA